MAKIIGRFFFQTHGFLTARNSVAPILRVLFCTNPSSQNKNLYSVLGVTPQANMEEIKNSYYSLSQKYHPDKHGGDKTTTEKFVEIKEAHELLSNPVEREKYDAENFPKHSQNSYTGASVRKEFKFHFYQPKKDPYAGFANWKRVKNFTRTSVSNFANSYAQRSAKGMKKLKRRHMAQKCAYDRNSGVEGSAKMTKRTSHMLCNLKK